MMIQAIGLLLISSVFMGIMSILRKEYQKRNSISVMPTVLFLFCVSIIGAGGIGCGRARSAYKRTEP